MSWHKNFSRGAKDYRRGKPQYLPSGKSFLIVTEGEKTEPNYFIALRNRLQLNATEVEISHPHGTDPITLVKKAIELRKIRKREAKKGINIDYDEVWVVFDLERIHDERRRLAIEATQLRESKGIKFAQSDPCFEFWLLLHEDFTTAPSVDCDSVIARLKRFWPNYSKGEKPSEEFLNKLPVAVVNAQRCRQHHTASNGDGNPRTDVDLLAVNLNNATRKHLRFLF